MGTSIIYFEEIKLFILHVNKHKMSNKAALQKSIFLEKPKCKPFWEGWEEFFEHATL